MSYQDTTTHAFDIDQMLLQYPQLWPYFYDDKLPPGNDDPEYYRVLAAAELYLDAAETIWRHHGEYMPTDVVGWREWIHDLLQHSPVLQDGFSKKPYWYPALLELVQEEMCGHSHDQVLKLRDQMRKLQPPALD
jgi:hypothetical protein